MFHQSSSEDELFVRNKSSHSWSLSSLVRRWTIWVLLFGFLVFFYITTNCWNLNTLGGIFSTNRRFMLEEIVRQHSGPLSKRTMKLCTPLGHVHNALPSLIVKPLRNVSQSNTVQALTVDRLHSLLKIANHSLLAKENLLNCSDKHFWNGHRESYLKRRQRLQRMCQRYGFVGKIFNSWHVSTNRRVVPAYHHHNHTKPDMRKFCSTRNCPLIVSPEHKLLTCFVQKVASTSIKHLYLYLLNQNLTANNTAELFEPVNNITNFHFKVNDELYRISPTYLAYSKEANYYKTMFIRHPFVRVVSAFKDKAERSPQEEMYFYTKYWNPLLDRLHGKQRDPNMRVTFREFVEELLLPTDPYQYDEHWAPIWTRCEPCFIHYDFIGKLETGEEDFRNFKSRVNQHLINVTIWENLNQQFGQSPMDGKSETEENKSKLQACQRQRLKYAETITYLSQLSPQTLIELYKRYYLDFELFGYTLDELFEAIIQYK